MIDHLLLFTAPHLCCGCSQTGTLLCDGCKEDIVWNKSGRCIVCERPAAQYLCSQHPEITGGWYVAERAGTLERLIDKYKFDSACAACRPLV